jgi:hypothetical protein
MKKLFLVLIIFLSLYKVEAQEEKGFSFGYSLFAAETFFSPMVELNLRMNQFVELNTMAQLNMAMGRLFLSKGVGATYYFIGSEKGWRLGASGYYVWNLLSYPYWDNEKNKYLCPISDALIVSFTGEFPFSVEDAIRNMVFNIRESCPKRLEGKTFYLTLSYGGDYFIDKKSVHPFIKIGLKRYLN